MPDRATVDFGIRHLAEEPVKGIIDRIGRADEFIAGDQLAACDRMLAALVDRLERGG